MKWDRVLVYSLFLGGDILIWIAVVWAIIYLSGKM